MLRLRRSSAGPLVQTEESEVETNEKRRKKRRKPEPRKKRNTKTEKRQDKTTGMVGQTRRRMKEGRTGRASLCARVRVS